MSLEPKPQPGPSRVSRVLAVVLDDLVRVPGTQAGFGLDGLLGLIPGIGDASTTTIAGLILADSIRNRVPLPVLARMGLNLGVDALLGAVPLVGDLADFAHRANRKNMRLLQQAVANREQTRTHAVVYLSVAITMVVVVLAVLVGLALWTLWLLFRLLTGG